MNISDYEEKFYRARKRRWVCRIFGHKWFVLTFTGGMRCCERCLDTK